MHFSNDHSHQLANVTTETYFSPFFKVRELGGKGVGQCPTKWGRRPQAALVLAGRSSIILENK